MSRHGEIKRLAHDHPVYARARTRVQVLCYPFRDDISWAAAGEKKKREMAKI